MIDVQHYLRRVHAACHNVVFGVLERNFFSATSSEVEDGFHCMHGDTRSALAPLHL